MLTFWRKLLRLEPELTPSRSTGRPRTYSAESGYQYEYSFNGFRRLRRHGESVIEYVFSVSSGRNSPVPVRVVLAERRLAEWSATGRDLTASERYGLAKISLKRELDRTDLPAALRQEIRPDQSEVAEIARLLDL